MSSCEARTDCPFSLSSSARAARRPTSRWPFQTVVSAGVARSELIGKLAKARRFWRRCKKVEQNLESDARQMMHPVGEERTTEHEKSAHGIGQVSV